VQAKKNLVTTNLQISKRQRLVSETEAKMARSSAAMDSTVSNEMVEAIAATKPKNEV
jgi:hypothetical protein